MGGDVSDSGTKGTGYRLKPELDAEVIFGIDLVLLRRPGDPTWSRF
jgi:hypothetical protein